MKTYQTFFWISFGIASLLVNISTPAVAAASLITANQPCTAKEICSGQASTDCIGLTQSAKDASSGITVSGTGQNQAIWSNDDASVKGPIICAAQGAGYQFTGNWWTTVWGTTSVVQCSMNVPTITKTSESYKVDCTNWNTPGAGCAYLCSHRSRDSRPTKYSWTGKFNQGSGYGNGFCQCKTAS